MDRTVVAITGPLEIKGLLSSKPVDPYAGLSESAGAAKANALIQKARYETAADVVRSMDKRHETKLLGPVYNALGDHAMTANQLDSAWGWYLMTVRNSIDPADLAHAHFGLAGYFTATGDSAKAADEYRAVLALPGVTDADKTRAQGLLDKSKS